MSKNIKKQICRKMHFIAVFTVVAVATLSAFGQKVPIEKQLQGYWKSTEAIIEFKPGSKVTINDVEYDFAVIGSTIVVGNDEGQIDLPYKLLGNTLTVWLELKKIVYTRMTEDEVAQYKKGKGRNNVESPSVGGNSGGVARELVGKWCYSANVNATGGGRQSDICFTLKADGTYEYYGEASNSNIYGGSNSQSWDYGRWSATATTLTARSNSGTTKTYTLEKRNHPKTGYAMLMVDGDAFVTFYQRPSW